VWSINLFHIKGIQIRVHVTFALVLLWGAYYWSSVADDGASGALFGVVATLLLFLCVTLHELGHAVQAVNYGITVEDITLYPIGGIARLSEIPKNPSQEFRIAIAGPLVNVGIVGVLTIAGAVAGITTWLTPGDLFDELRNPTWRSLFPYLVMSNLWLALFNLLPAFPMDGGRILRSLLAMRMPYRRATAIAASIGQAMALLFGLYGFATGQYLLILVAFFVWMGAGEEGRQTAMHELLGTTTVGDAMIRQPWSVAPDFPLRRAVELTLTTAQSDFPVVARDGTVVGLLTLRDLLEALQRRPDASIGEVMRREFPSARPDERIAEIQERIAQNGGRAIPVLSRTGSLVGLITTTDIGEVVSVLAAQQAEQADGATSLPVPPA
jgi:stage IV sporulation protein FB